MREKKAFEMVIKIESLYMTKFLNHRFCLKQQLYSFCMAENKTVMEKLEKTLKIIDDLKIILVEVDNEDKSIILLS